MHKRYIGGLDWSHARLSSSIRLTVDRPIDGLRRVEIVARERYRGRVLWGGHPGRAPFPKTLRMDAGVTVICGLAWGAALYNINNVRHSTKSCSGRVSWLMV